MNSSEETIELEHVRRPSWRQMKAWERKELAEFLLYGWIIRLLAHILIFAIWIAMGVVEFSWGIAKRRGWSHTVGICIAGAIIVVGCIAVAWIALR